MTDTTPSKPAPGRRLADLPEPRAILFDLDGTLVKTVHLRAQGWVEAFRDFGITVDLDRLPSYMGSDGRWLARELARDGGREIDWATSDEIDRAAGANFDRLNTGPDALPGATELLTELESSRLLYCIATASQPGQVQVSVGALRLPNPPRIVDASNVANAKPEPDLLLAAAEQLGTAPADCWYVGDSAWDMMASAAAGMSGIAVTTGATSAEALIAAGADVAVASLEDVHAELVRRQLLRGR
jgi:HAD superfamily hydrolase (TIGR01509 family)